jgi:hypothetical protein
LLARVTLKATEELAFRTFPLLTLHRPALSVVQEALRAVPSVQAPSTVAPATGLWLPSRTSMVTVARQKLLFMLRQEPVRSHTCIWVLLGGAAVGVGVNVGAGVLVGVAVAVNVGVMTGVAVDTGVGVLVFVAVAVGVAVAVLVGVAVAVATGVEVAVLVAVAVGVAEAMAVPVAKGVFVAVGLGADPPLGSVPFRNSSTLV